MGAWEIEAWRTALDEATQVTDADAAAKAWKAAATTAGNDRATMLLRRWTELDPKGALATLMAEGDTWHAEEVLHDWAHQDAVAACEAWLAVRAKLAAAGSPRFQPLREPRTLAELLAQHLAQTSLPKALAMAGRLGQEEDASTFRQAAVLRLAREQPAQALKHLEDIDDSTGEECVKLAGRALGRRDFQEARRIGGKIKAPVLRVRFLEAAVAGWAGQEPRAALKEVSKRLRSNRDRGDLDFSAALAFLAAAERNPQVALAWLSQQGADEQVDLARSLLKAIEQEDLPAAEILRAAPRAGLNARALKWIEYAPDVGLPSVPFDRPRPPKYPEHGGLLAHSQQLAKFLADRKPSDFPALWRRPFRDRELEDEQWLAEERRLILKAWTMKDPMAALARPHGSGTFAKALWDHFSDSSALLADWAASDSSAFLVQWQHGLRLPTPYDEGDRFGRLTAAAAAVEGLSRKDAAEAWKWYLEVYQQEHATIGRAERVDDQVVFPTSLLETRASQDVDAAFQDLSEIRRSAKDPIDEMALARFYHALGASCRRQNLVDPEKRTADLPEVDRNSFKSGFERQPPHQ